MDDLVKFLRARLDETAAKAEAAAAELGADWYYGDGSVLARRENDMVATGSQDFLERERGEHIARHDPARVLADIDAKRRLVEMHGQAHECVSYDWVSKEINTCMWVDADEVCTTLRLLALPYADHPDYREEWRP